MSILDTIAQRFGYAKTQPTISPERWLRTRAEYESWNLPPLSMPEAQSELYMRLSWVQIAINAKASVAATTRFSVKQMVGEEENDIPNHPFEELLSNPNPNESRFELLEALFSFLDITGNGYWWLNRSNANQPPSEIWTIEPSKIQPVPDKRLYLRGYLYEINGQKVPLELHEVAHFKRFHPLRSFVGLSAIEALATVAASDLARQKFDARVYGKDGGRMPQTLIFADPIDDSDWADMKREVRAAGDTHQLMMLRNAGRGGVELIQSAMSQKDTEFFTARDRTKEEIFAMFAPGLASVLAINATEANALAGKSTFAELAVWPQLTRVAEKITNDVLPAYGENLKGEFDDVRVTDRAMELQEQTAFAQVATVDEIRQKYYQLDPIGDERGELFPAELTRGRSITEPPQQPPAFVVDNAQQEQLALPAPAKAHAPQLTRQQRHERERETAQFRKWAGKRTQPNPAEFEAVYLSDEDKRAILQEDSDAEDIPFPDGRAALKRPQIDEIDAYQRDIADLIGRANDGDINRDEFEKRVIELTILILLLAMRKGSGLSAEELLADEAAAGRLAEAEAQARESAQNLADDVYMNRRFVVGDTANPDTPTLTAEEAASRRENRASLWAAVALGLYAIGQTLQPDDPFLEWEVGPTEHCGDCLRLNTQVHRASEWNASGWHPQTSVLECNGYHCQCALVPASGPSRGGF